MSAYDWFGSLAFQPIGLILAGPAAAALGTSTTLWIAAVEPDRHRGAVRRDASVRRLES